MPFELSPDQKPEEAIATLDRFKIAYSAGLAAARAAARALPRLRNRRRVAGRQPRRVRPREALDSL